MKIKLILVITILILGLLQVSGIQHKNSSKNASQNSGFIKMNLLHKIPLKPVKAVRNIFRPQSRRASGLDEENLDDMGYMNKMNQKGIEGKPDLEEHGAFPPEGTIAYIGFTGSSKKSIALIVFQDKLISVIKGDWLGELYQVEKISHSEVVLSGKDSLKKSLPFLGEKK